MQQVGPVLGEERIAAEISSETTTAKDHWTILFRAHARLLVNATNHATIRGQKLVHTSLVNYSCFLRCLGNLLKSLHQGISYCHSWGAFSPTMRTRHRVATKTCDERQVKLKLV